MNNHTVLAEPDGAATRQRHYQDVTRLLREYTEVVYELARQIAVSLDAVTKKKSSWSFFSAERSRATNEFPWSLYSAIQRYRSVWRPLHDVALFASQMLIHYGLEDAEKAELDLRRADAENGIETILSLIEVLRDERLDQPIRHLELVKIVEEVQLGLNRNTSP